jgi:hypothetical protein
VARKLNPKTADAVRAHIKGLMLVNLLQNHADGKTEMSATRIDAAKFLLSYVLPKPAQTVENLGTVTLKWL